MGDSDPAVLLRTVLDESLPEFGFTLRDEEGHVYLFDGDLNTGEFANDVIEKMAALGWGFVR